jgi:hypothetical protein
MPDACLRIASIKGGAQRGIRKSLRKPLQAQTDVPGRECISVVRIAAQAILKAKSTDVDAVRSALAGLKPTKATR